MRHADCDFNEDIVNDFNRKISSEGKKKSNLVLKELIKKKMKDEKRNTLSKIKRQINFYQSSKSNN